jgi:cbb3-type cytochrome oxidase maturation protein
MFYYFPWILLMAASLLASLALFIWALKRGQFSDQDRARYLPLRHELSLPKVKDPAGLSLEVYVLLGTLAVGFSFLVVTIMMALGRTMG